MGKISTFKTRKKSDEVDGQKARSFWTSTVLSRSFSESLVVPMVSNKRAVCVQTSLPGAALQKEHNVMLVPAVRGTYFLVPGEQMQLVPVARCCRRGAPGEASVRKELGLPLPGAAASHQPKPSVPAMLAVPL